MGAIEINTDTTVVLVKEDHLGAVKFIYHHANFILHFEPDPTYEYCQRK